jgi:hypothetical protein
MRKVFNLYKKDGTKLEYGDDKFYTYDSSYNLVTTATPKDEIGVVISNKISLRSREYIVDGLKKTANDILLKAPKTDSIALSKFIDFPAEDSVLVGQGLSSPAIWKTYDSIFPASVYEVQEGEALRYEGSTMLSSYFQNTDVVIYNGKVINKVVDYILKTTRITNASAFYSGVKVSINYVPSVTNITSINGTTVQNGSLHSKNFYGYFNVNVPYSYNMTVSKRTFYMYNALENSIRPIECTIEPLPASPNTTKNYKVYLPLTFVTKAGDDVLYSGHINVKTSLTDKYRYITNLVVNEEEIIHPYYTYNTEIKSASNTISSTLPVNLNVTSMGIGDHHGFYIDLQGKLNSFGTDMRGEISRKPTGRFEQVACGLYHSVAIDSNGNLVSWGTDEFRQVLDTPSGEFKKVYAKYNLSAAITTDDRLFVWGDPIHLAVDNVMTDVLDVAIGERFIAVLKIDGSIIIIGDDTYGQRSNIPTGKFKRIACGKNHISAIGEDGKFYIWGSNDDRQQLNASSITETVIDIVCTDMGGGALTSTYTFKPYGDITQTGLQKYNKLVAGNYNIVLLKNSEMTIQRDFIKRTLSGDAFDMNIEIDVPDVAISKIYVDLDVLE